MLNTGLMLMLLAAVSACSPAGSEMGPDERPAQDMPMMPGRSGGMMGGDMMQGGMGGNMMGDMSTIHGLLGSHERIERTVQNIPGGVRTVTTSEDPEVAALIRTHVREMKARYERGQPIRAMDPVFRELFRHREKASMRIEDIPGGVRVVHTSEDPEVALLIRQHAHRFVSEAADEGMSRAMRPTPLPEGYSKPAR